MSNLKRKDTNSIGRAFCGAGTMALLLLGAWAIDGSAATGAKYVFTTHCTDCHADVLDEPTLDPSIRELTAHGTMLPWAPGKVGNDDQCVWCHRSVNLAHGLPVPHDALQGSFRKHVDPTLCTLCHGPDGSGRQFYQVGLSGLVSDGASLYDLLCASCHRDLANSEVRGKSAAEIRKIIDNNGGGMGPLEVLSTAQILLIADVLAEQ